MKKKGFKKAAIATAALCLAVSMFAVAGCTSQPAPAKDDGADAAKTEQPAAAAEEKTPAADSATDAADKKPASATADTLAMPGDFQNKDAGSFTETDYNTNFINDGNRGCSACHDDLYAVMGDLSPIQHVLSSPAGYGQTYDNFANDCMACHHYNVKFGGPRLSAVLHASHYANPTFTDDMNGNCWSCHATNLAGEMVMWDEYKYSAEMAGYVDSGDPSVAEQWLNLRQWNNDSLTDVALDRDVDIKVELSQPVLDEKDMFIADNYLIPEFTEDSYKLKVVGANEEKTLTLADLKAMPQTEITATQMCLTNPINGTMIGNIPVKGVKVEDFIEAIGGIPEGKISMACMGDDQWGHETSLQFLIDQGAVLALEMWGHELSADQGYPLTLVIPGCGGAFWDKWITTITFGENDKATSGTWPLMAMFPDGFQGVMGAGWFTPNKDGLEYKVGDTVEIKGYSFNNSNMGHTMEAVAFSADYGHNWVEVEIPDSFDQGQWVIWEGTWTPEKAGTYVLQVKTIDSDGGEPYRPSSVIVKVTE